mmetsp:Transcript_113059/g.365126  ORF Transcript_113059/g.365126 Transcript_113059/m.365126 type:complete len:203 (-) Transcript_113059:116-724(-)
MVGLVLEPHGHVWALAGPVQRDRAVSRCQLPAVVHEVRGEPHAARMQLQLIVRALARVERHLHAPGEIVLPCVSQGDDMGLQRGRDGAAIVAALKHVGREFQRRLLLLHGQDGGNDQREQHEDRWKHQLRGPGTAVAAHGERALDEEGAELLQVEGEARLQLHGLPGGQGGSWILRVHLLAGGGRARLRLLDPRRAPAAAAA